MREMTTVALSMCKESVKSATVPFADAPELENEAAILTIVPDEDGAVVESLLQPDATSPTRSTERTATTARTAEEKFTCFIMNLPEMNLLTIGMTVKKRTLIDAFWFLNHQV
jgi:hypothetical protein